MMGCNLQKHIFASLGFPNGSGKRRREEFVYLQIQATRDDQDC